MRVMLNMLPSFAPNKKGNCRLIHAKLLGQLRLAFPGNPSNTYFFDFDFGQFAKVCVLSFSRLSPSFFKTVSGIVAHCSNKQMPWITAWWIIAFMANAQPFWNRAKTCFPAKPVSQFRNTVNCHFVIFYARLISVKIPAFISTKYVHSLPKLFRHLRSSGFPTLKTIAHNMSMITLNCPLAT